MKLSVYTKTGILVTAAGVGLYLGINFLKGKNIFKKEVAYTILYDRIDGLNLSSSVEVRGLKIGRVSNISFSGQGYSKLAVSVIVSDEMPIPKGSIGRIYSSDLMGTKSIEIILGASDTMLAPGDTIGSEIEGSIGDQVKLQMLPLKRKAEDLMVSMEKALEAVKYVFNEEIGAKLQQSLLTVQVAINGLQTATSNLDTIMVESKDKFSKILTNVQSISKNIDNNNKNITGVLTNLNSITDSLAASNLTQAVNNASVTLAESKKLLAQINSGEGTMGKLIYNDSLYLNLAQASKDLDKLLIDINANPKKYVQFSLINKNKK